jgi:hypothetical protein
MPPYYVIANTGQRQHFKCRHSMKHLILIIYFFYLPVGFGYSVSEATNLWDNDRQNTINNINMLQDNVAYYFIIVPFGLDTIEFKAQIILDTTKEIHIIKFPNGGTQTEVFIYDSTYLKIVQLNTLPKAKALKKGNFRNEQEALLNITSLPRGNYYVHYLSCGIGGVFPLTIK